MNIKKQFTELEISLDILINACRTLLGSNSPFTTKLVLIKRQIEDIKSFVSENINE